MQLLLGQASLIISFPYPIICITFPAAQHPIINPSNLLDYFSPTNICIFAHTACCWGRYWSNVVDQVPSLLHSFLLETLAIFSFFFSSWNFTWKWRVGGLSLVPLAPLGLPGAVLGEAVGICRVWPVRSQGERQPLFWTTVCVFLLNPIFTLWAQFPAEV